MRLTTIVHTPLALAGHRYRCVRRAAPNQLHVARTALAVAAGKAASLNDRHAGVRFGVRAQRNATAATGDHVLLADVQRLAAHAVMDGRLQFAGA